MVRFAEEHELSRVNELRKQVNDLHVKGEPEIFKPGFSKALADHICTVWNDPAQKIIVNERDGMICGFAVLHQIRKPETPFMFARDFLDVDELCVDETCRRTGVATELIEFIRAYAKQQGFARVELNMWEFNSDALAFYEKAGFTTYRRYLAMDL